MPLGNALRTEGDVHVLAELPQAAIDHRRDSWVDGAAEHEELALYKMLDIGIQSSHDRADVRAEVAIDRCADHDNDGRGGADDAGIRRRHEVPAGLRGGQQLVGTLLQEWHPARVDQIHRGGIHVVEGHCPAAGRERDAQGQPHVTAAAEDDQVTFDSQRLDLHLARIGLRVPRPGVYGRFRDRDMALW